MNYKDILLIQVKKKINLNRIIVRKLILKFGEICQKVVKSLMIFNEK